MREDEHIRSRPGTRTFVQYLQLLAICEQISGDTIPRTCTNLIFSLILRGGGGMWRVGYPFRSFSFQWIKCLLFE